MAAPLSRSTTTSECTGHFIVPESRRVSVLQLGRRRDLQAAPPKFTAVAVARALYSAGRCVVLLYLCEFFLQQLYFRCKQNTLYTEQITRTKTHLVSRVSFITLLYFTSRHQPTSHTFSWRQAPWPPCSCCVLQRRRFGRGQAELVDVAEGFRQPAVSWRGGRRCRRDRHHGGPAASR